jgi:3-methyladenine DNA glycosylase AlkD
MNSCRKERLIVSSVNEVLKKLKERAKPENLEGMAKYGMTRDRRLGVAVPEMRKIAKQSGKDHRLALDLWRTGIPEAMMVASMVDLAEAVTEEQMEDWVKDFNSWDVCDQVCMNLFAKTPLAWKKIRDWANRDEEFVKRAAFALIACLAWHDKEASDKEFIDLVPLIVEGVTDERNLVKKGVSWALRHIGKRNPNLNEVAMKTAKEMQQMNSKPASVVFPVRLDESSNRR